MSYSFGTALNVYFTTHLLHAISCVFTKMCLYHLMCTLPHIYYTQYSIMYAARALPICKAGLESGKRDLVSGKRDLVCWQKRPSMLAKEA